MMKPKNNLKVYFDCTRVNSVNELMGMRTVVVMESKIAEVWKKTEINLLIPALTSQVLFFVEVT